MPCCDCQGIQIVLEWSLDGGATPTEVETAILARLGWYQWFDGSIPWDTGVGQVLPGESWTGRWKNVGYPAPISFFLNVETFHLLVSTGVTSTQIIIEDIDTWSSLQTVSVSDPDDYKALWLTQAEVPYIP